MGVDYSFYVKFIATYAPTFLGYNKSVLVIVKSHWSNSNRQGLTSNVFPLLKFEAIIEFFTELNQMFPNHVEMTMYKIQFWNSTSRQCLWFKPEIIQIWVFPQVLSKVAIEKLIKCSYCRMWHKITNQNCRWYSFKEKCLALVGSLTSTFFNWIWSILWSSYNFQKAYFDCSSLCCSVSYNL